MARPPENVVLLGPRKALVGIATLPPAADPGAGTTWAVILNAGIIHRVGPNRLHVELARTIAERGIPVVRVDLSGIGDSEPRSDGLAPLEAALADIRETLDSIAARNAARTRFVLIGLCSGANHAIITAAADERVVGVALMDPLIPHTARYHVNHFVGRLFRAQSWRNSLRADHPLWRLLGRMLRGAKDEPPRDPSAPDAETVRRFL
ncbi:MAG: alpha/beta fold hydrolase, partial [Steroidobacteraceae bacterium]